MIKIIKPAFCLLDFLGVKLLVAVAYFSCYVEGNLYTDTDIHNIVSTLAGRLHFLRFFIMDKSGVIYMSIHFHRYITRQKMSELRQRFKNSAFGPKRQRKQKIEKSKRKIPRVFAISFKEKRNYSNRTTRSMRLGGSRPGSTLYCFCTCIL